MTRSRRTDRPRPPSSRAAALAEATLFVSATKRDNEAKVVHVDRDQLNAGHFVFADADAPGAVTQVSCGQVARDQWATIADFDTARELADGEVGEIGCTAPTSARGWL